MCLDSRLRLSLEKEHRVCFRVQTSVTKLVAKLVQSLTSCRCPCGASLAEARQIHRSLKQSCHLYLNPDVKHNSRREAQGMKARINFSRKGLSLGAKHGKTNCHYPPHRVECSLVNGTGKAHRWKTLLWVGVWEQADSVPVEGPLIWESTFYPLPHLLKAAQRSEQGEHGERKTRKR